MLDYTVLGEKFRGGDAQVSVSPCLGFSWKGFSEMRVLCAPVMLRSSDYYPWSPGNKETQCCYIVLLVSLSHTTVNIAG